MRAVDKDYLPLYNLFSKFFDFPIDKFIKLYYNNYSKTKEMTTNEVSVYRECAVYDFPGGLPIWQRTG